MPPRRHKTLQRHVIFPEPSPLASQINQRTVSLVFAVVSERLKKRVIKHWVKQEFVQRIKLRTKLTYSEQNRKALQNHLEGRPKFTKNIDFGVCCCLWEANKTGRTEHKSFFHRKIVITNKPNVWKWNCSERLPKSSQMASQTRCWLGCNRLCGRLEKMVKHRSAPPHQSK